MKQVYVIPTECVEHLMDDDFCTFKDREKAKRIGTKCGNIYSMFDFEQEVNSAAIDLSESVILID